MIATEEYHNTILLLKQYRMMKFQADLKKKQYEKKASFDNILSAKLEQEWAEIQLNDMLLNDIITALNFVKDYPSEGELYYSVFYNAENESTEILKIQVLRSKNLYYNLSFIFLLFLLQYIS